MHILIPNTVTSESFAKNCKITIVHFENTTICSSIGKFKIIQLADKTYLHLREASEYFQVTTPNTPKIDYIGFAPTKSPRKDLLEICVHKIPHKPDVFINNSKYTLSKGISEIVNSHTLYIGDFRYKIPGIDVIDKDIYAKDWKANNLKYYTPLTWDDELIRRKGFTYPTY